jgi:hypothetical protein
MKLVLQALLWRVLIKEIAFEIGKGKVIPVSSREGL